MLLVFHLWVLAFDKYGELCYDYIMIVYHCIIAPILHLFKSSRFRKCGMISVCCCVATCWADCLAMVWSILNPDIFPFCPYSNVSTVCNSSCFFTLSLRRWRITRCGKTVINKFIIVKCSNILYYVCKWWYFLSFKISIFLLLYHCGTSVFQLFDNDIFQF